jgi:hypothetical protein
MTLEIEVHSGELRDASTLAKSQVIGVFGLLVVGYTLGLYLHPIDLISGLAQIKPTSYQFPWFKKKNLDKSKLSMWDIPKH